MENEDKTYLLKLPPDIHKRAKQLAIETDRTINQVIIDAIEELLKAVEVMK